MKRSFMLCSSIFLCLIGCSPKTSQFANDPHSFVSGVWVEAEGYERIKAGDISEPHPLGYESLVSIHTCMLNGTPHFTNYATYEGSGYREGNEFILRDTFNNGDIITSRLHFISSAEDTVLHFTTNHNKEYTMRKAPHTLPCTRNDFDATSDVYNHFYFKGDYEVEDVKKGETFIVSIQDDLSVQGFYDKTFYFPLPGGRPLLFVLGDKKYEKEYFAFVQTEDGFDLFECDHTDKKSIRERRVKVYDVVFHFRRIQ